jgi:hypothetical protein
MVVDEHKAFFQVYWHELVMKQVINELIGKLSLAEG